jgi:hypothetical protein
MSVRPGVGSTIDTVIVSEPPSGPGNVTEFVVTPGSVSKSAFPPSFVENVTGVILAADDETKINMESVIVATAIVL